MEQLLVHVLGDYVLQSDYMAMNKSKRSIPCFIHVFIYTSCFLLLTASWKALLVIGVTHFLLDRYHTPLKKFIWHRGFMNPSFNYPPYLFCNTTGYYDDSPYNTKPYSQQTISDKQSLDYMFGKPRLFSVTMWLYIIHDNWIHLTINYFALKYLL